MSTREEGAHTHWEYNRFFCLPGLSKTQERQQTGEYLVPYINSFEKTFGDVETAREVSHSLWLVFGLCFITISVVPLFIVDDYIESLKSHFR